MKAYVYNLADEIVDVVLIGTVSDIVMKFETSWDLDEATLILGQIPVGVEIREDFDTINL